MNQQQHTQYNLDELAVQAMKFRDMEPDFDSEVKKELNAITKPPLPSPNGQIRDMRDKFWFSIDNDDSRDLDQITYAEKLPDGSYKIYVSIADVSSLVPIGSAIDEHAEHNTTSVYTPTIIFPMLPEKLSTDLTSLGQDADRLSIVFEMSLDNKGIVQSSQIYQALVRNKAKLAYNSVGSWLETNTNPPPLVEKNPALQEKLKLHDEIAQKMKAYRQSKGMLSLETIETRAIIVNRMVVDIVQVKKNRAREIIENFMIAANVASTNFLHSKNFPAFKRIVKVPKDWNRIVELAGEQDFKLPSTPDSSALEHFLVKMHQEKPVEYPDLSLSVIKLLGRGEYIVEMPKQSPTGHFGLALRNYSHSTAPNRRYPDLITQRLLKAVLDNKPCPYPLDYLNSLARHCSAKEADADKVARQMQKSAAATLLVDQIGHTFDGIITGCGPSGTWVRVFEPPVEGKLVKGINGCEVGNRMQVKLMGVNIPSGHIDFSKV